MKLLTILILTICAAITFGQTTKPFVLGEIDEIQSTELAEKRILNIYLPDGYKSSNSAKFPVVYLLDGGQDEDFIHVVGLYQFNNFSWINRVPKSIIVGIANVDRRRDFTFPTTIEDEKKNSRPADIQPNSSLLSRKSYSPTLTKNTGPTIQEQLSDNHLADFWQPKFCLENHDCSINTSSSVQAFGGIMEVY